MWVLYSHTLNNPEWQTYPLQYSRSTKDKIVTIVTPSLRTKQLNTLSLSVYIRIFLFVPLTSFVSICQRMYISAIYICI